MSMLLSAVKVCFLITCLIWPFFYKNVEVVIPVMSLQVHNVCVNVILANLTDWQIITEFVQTGI